MITTTLNLKGFDNLARRLKTLAATKVKVGFFEEDRYDDGMPVAQVAAYNEFGTRFHPERPFMRETLEDKQTRKNYLKDSWQQLGPRSITQAMHAASLPP